jgi:hypothetical protein
MSKHRFARISLALTLLASAALGQESPPFDPEACAKHCREMATARAKAADASKARMQQREAAWKEIETQLQLARSSRGDKKLAALEAAVEKLVAYEASASGMPDCPMMGGTGMGAGGCCGGSMPDCCGTGRHAARHAHCP